MRCIILFGLCTLFCFNIFCHHNNGNIENKNDSTQLTKVLEEGKKIFKSDCNTCHGWKEKTDNNLTNIVNRLGTNYLEVYITKQDSLIMARNKYAVAIKQEYGNTGNSHNFKYDNHQLKCLIEYLKK